MIIDSHCHIPHRKYEKSIEDILFEAKESGVVKVITIGTSLKENALVKEVALKYPEVYFTVAIYPHEEMGNSIEESLKSLEEKFLINKHPKLVAIGECGIDITNWQRGRSLEEQLILFESQIKLAIKYNLPLVIHNRNGNTYVLDLLKKYIPLGLRGTIHCIDANWDFAKQVLDMGFYISFSGMITYPKKDYLLEVVKSVPLNKFLIETDAPYLAPQKHRGEVNYSKYVKMVAEKVAEVKNESIDVIEKSSYENTSKLFGL